MSRLGGLSGVSGVSGVSDGGDGGDGGKSEKIEECLRIPSEPHPATLLIEVVCLSPR